MAGTYQSFETLAEKFRVIGHPVRIAILDLLCNCGYSKLTVKSIYRTLELDQPNASRHLGIMRKSNILERIQAGGDTFYCLCKNNQVACITACFKGNTRIIKK
jgi:DNA-binding transcriptional ArsR family regulator